MNMLAKSKQDGMVRPVRARPDRPDHARTIKPFLDSGYSVPFAPGCGAQGKFQEAFVAGASQSCWPGQVFVASGQHDLQSMALVGGRVGLSSSQADDTEEST